LAGALLLFSLFCLFQALVLLVQEEFGSSLMPRDAVGAGGAPRRQVSAGCRGAGQPSLHPSASVNPRRGHQLPNNVPSTSRPKSQGKLTRSPRSQPNIITNKARVRAYSKTASAKENHDPEPDVLRQPVPEPVPEPPTASSPTSSCRYPSLRVSHESACWTPPEPLSHSSENTKHEIRKPSCKDGSLTPLTQDAAVLNSARETDDVLCESLGGKLDDLCRRTLALEQDLQAQCLHDPMETRLQSMNDDFQQPIGCRASADDVIPDLLSWEEGVVMPKASNGAVERELHSLRNCITGMQANLGELKGMIQQLDSEMRSFGEFKHREATRAPLSARLVKVSSFSTIKCLVDISSLAAVQPSRLPIVKPSGSQRCLVRSCSQNSVRTLSSEMIPVGSASCSAKPAMNAAVHGKAISAATVAGTSSVQSLRKSPSVSPIRPTTPSGSPVGMLMGRPLSCTRTVLSQDACSVQRRLSSAFGP